MSTSVDNWGRGFGRRRCSSRPRTGAESSGKTFLPKSWAQNLRNQATRDFGTEGRGFESFPARQLCSRCCRTRARRCVIAWLRGAGCRCPHGSYPASWRHCAPSLSFPGRQPAAAPMARAEAGRVIARSQWSLAIGLCGAERSPASLRAQRPRCSRRGARRIGFRPCPPRRTGGRFPAPHASRRRARRSTGSWRPAFGKERIPHSSPSRCSCPKKGTHRATVSVPISSNILLTARWGWSSRKSTCFVFEFRLRVPPPADCRVRGHREEERIELDITTTETALVFLHTFGESDLAVVVAARVDEPMRIDKCEVLECFRIRPQEEVREETAFLEEADALASTAVSEEIDGPVFEIGRMVLAEFPQLLQ